MKVPTTPVPVSAAMQRRATQFGFRVKGAMTGPGVEAHIGQPVHAGALRPHVVYNAIDCPYCHEACETHIADQIVRIVGMIDPRTDTAPPQTPVLAEIAPPDTVICTCQNCRETFYISRHSLGHRPE